MVSQLITLLSHLVFLKGLFLVPCYFSFTSIILRKRSNGIIKYLSKFLPLYQMYKALVRSHLDYCYVIYHIPALNSLTNLGVTLTSSTEKVEILNTKLPLLLLVHVKVLTGQNITRNWNGTRNGNGLVILRTTNQNYTPFPRTFTISFAMLTFFDTSFKFYP